MTAPSLEVILGSPFFLPSHVVHHQVLSVSFQNPSQIHPPSLWPAVHASVLSYPCCLQGSDFVSLHPVLCPAAKVTSKTVKVRSCHSPAQSPSVQQRVPTALQTKHTHSARHARPFMLWPQPGCLLPSARVVPSASIIGLLSSGASWGLCTCCALCKEYTVVFMD